MMTWSNTANSGSGQAVSAGNLVVAGSIGSWSLWCATAMDLTLGNGGSPSVVNEANRTLTTCYMRGLKENIRIQTSSGLPWFHRRVCFKYKGGPQPFDLKQTADTPSVLYQSYQDTSNGIERLLFNQFVNAQPNTISAQQAVIFRGSQGKDWDDPVLAPIDTTRVDLCYDKTRTYKSGNTAGTLKELKLWHPMNKNLTYDDDEDGDIELSGGSYFSTQDKRGMGNYYILDIISPGAGASASDLLIMKCNSQLFWHEK